MLHFAVRWVDQHPLDWLDSAFPTSYAVEGWRLNLREATLEAVPPTPMSVDGARSAIAPILDTWAAALEMEQRLVVMFYYLGAAVEPAATGTGTAVGADFATASITAFDATVAIQRDAPPEPDWSWRETDVTRLARTMCLRPLRNGSRPVADAANWLSTHLEKWAGGPKAAAHHLNVSCKFFDRFAEWAARSCERKVSPNSRTLTTQDKESLKGAVEELIRRLHLVESGLDPGEYLDLSDWPTS
ncbi:hypothetical protein [Streptomyces sp. NPDC093589]|uniref:hypothetical protein n=1 Tax=Streptomyces sp. NPDC093589 TaxID=3366043 RepID=UPI00382D31E3